MSHVLTIVPIEAWLWRPTTCWQSNGLACDDAKVAWLARKRGHTNKETVQTDR